MTPTEFEHFVRQLFEARGLEGWTTERTGDDGVDAVVLNRDPLVDGLTIVQAKKCTRVLGVNHILVRVGLLDEGHRERSGRADRRATSALAGPAAPGPGRSGGTAGRTGNDMASRDTGISTFSAVIIGCAGAPWSLGRWWTCRRRGSGAR